MLNDINQSKPSLHSTKEVADLFGVRTATILNWAGAFKVYLSDRVRHRQRSEHYWFTDEDVEVFRLVHRLSEQNYPYELIHRHLADSSSIATEPASETNELQRSGCLHWKLGFALSLFGAAGWGLVTIAAIALLFLH